MTHRLCLTIFILYIGTVASKAQLSKQDSIKLQNLMNGKGEININMEAVKNIQFDFNPSKDILNNKPMMSEEKSWLKYLNDLPKNYLDTTKWVKPKYVRMKPYTIFTQYGEDPVNDPIFAGKKDSLKIRMKLNLVNNTGIKNGFRVLPKGMDQDVTPSNNPTATFSFEDLLAPIFSTKARTRKRNAKYAIAWKTYQDFLPIKRDTINAKQDTVLIKRDSILYIEELIKRDSVVIKRDSITTNP